MKAALYARVSTDDKGQIPEVQLDQVRKFCQDAGWEVAGEYVDKASADDFVHRVSWAQLMKDASCRKFEVIVIWKLDRAFRSVIDGANVLGLLRSYGIKFRSVQESFIDTTTPFGEMMYHISMAWAQLEKDLIKVRVNAGLDYARRHGTKSGLAIGRPKRRVSLQSICNALTRCSGNYSAAARDLSEETGQKIQAALVHQRTHRAATAAGLSVDELLKLDEVTLQTMG